MDLVGGILIICLLEAVRVGAGTVEGEEMVDDLESVVSSRSCILDHITTMCEFTWLWKPLALKKTWWFWDGSA